MSRFARFITQAPLLVARHLWIWPAMGAIVLVAVGFWVRSRVEGATQEELASRLQTLLKADVTALRLWFSEREYDANSFASEATVQASAADLAAMADRPNPNWQNIAKAEPADDLRLYLRSVLEAQHYQDFFIVGRDKRILAWPRHPRMVGHSVPRSYEVFIARALAGRPAVSRPFAWQLNPPPRPEGLTMIVAAPVKSTNGLIVAALALRMAPEKDFSRLFSVARMGETGESYAFDHRGFMLTDSRFDDELKRLGLIPKAADATSILNLRLTDPGVDLDRTAPPSPPDEPAPPDEPVVAVNLPRVRSRGFPGSQRPLTRMAAAAIRGLDGADVKGYRNYRGMKVVGAWQWLPEYGMGVATEVSAEEAFQTLYMLREAFLVLFGLLVLSGLAIFVFSLAVEHLQSSVRKSALTARRLGQYVLVQEIGRGANGMVYRARHSLLRRPVAVKLLSPDMTNDSTAARFEHEVQMTSQLTHPNTVAIYDYGRTPEGLFYYAMEFLNGIDLDQLVRQFGPQPPGRIIHILRQACGSLAEAHRIGLIHRDIKPANLVLTRRGGVSDIVKVLDFGMVKARNSTRADQTAANIVVGTPHFMPPESIENPSKVDARSDLYSLGAVGYWLLTGKTLFASHEVPQLLKLQVQEMPLSPSERLGKSISPDLEKVLMRCLSKDPAGRPASADELDLALSQCASAGAWTAHDGARWWEEHLAGIEISPAVAMAEKTLVIGPRT